MKNRNLLYCTLIAGAGMLAGVLLTVSAVGVLLYSCSPEGPAQSEGVEGKYYNWLYTLSPCPSASLERYEDANISFLHFSYKDAPNMERHNLSDIASKPLAMTMLKYSLVNTYAAGNISVDMYAPKSRKPAGQYELKQFVGKYAEQELGGKPQIEYGTIPGAPFSAYFKSGAREGVCFTDRHGTIYFFTDQNMAMQRGSMKFVRRLFASIGIGSYSLDDYALGGMKDWFVRPSLEKRSECNYWQIKKTVTVRGNK